MRSPASSAAGFVTFAGLALLLLGCILGVFPLLPVTTRGGGGMEHVPHAAAGAALLAAAGVGLLLWQRFGSAAGPR
jgi:hypothetical protein